MKWADAVSEEPRRRTRVGSRTARREARVARDPHAPELSFFSASYSSSSCRRSRGSISTAEELGAIVRRPLRRSALPRNSNALESLRGRKRRTKKRSDAECSLASIPLHSVKCSPSGISECSTIGIFCKKMFYVRGLDPITERVLVLTERELRFAREFLTEEPVCNTTKVKVYKTRLFRRTDESFSVEPFFFRNRNSPQILEVLAYPLLVPLE